MSKILIYDDNADLLECLQLCLEEFDFEVKATGDRKHFHWLLDNFEPNIMLLDVHLGGEDGRVICRSLRDDSKYSEIPIVLFSSNSEKLRDFKEYGADDVFEKPFEVMEIAPRLLTAIEKRKELIKRETSSAN
jgi:DNA-binding response OmpR family regulator